VALHSEEAEKAAKLATRQERGKGQSQATTAIAAERFTHQTQVGDIWMLERHLVYCGDTASDEFRDCLPSDAALAIVPLSAPWNHDYLAEEARVVAVLCPEGRIHAFCHQHRMPFQFELLLGNLYVAICSRQTLLKPANPIGIEGIEGIVTYLISLYTKPGNFVINPMLGDGAALIACDRLGRVCFASDAQPEAVQRALCRWQKWTGKQPEKTSLAD